MIKSIPFFTLQIFGQKRKKKRFNHRAAKVEFINNDILKDGSFLSHTNGKSLNYLSFALILSESSGSPRGGGAPGAGRGRDSSCLKYLSRLKKAADPSGNRWDVGFLCFKRQTPIIAN